MSVLLNGGLECSVGNGGAGLQVATTFSLRISSSGADSAHSGGSASGGLVIDSCGCLMAEETMVCHFCCSGIYCLRQGVIPFQSFIVKNSDVSTGAFEQGCSFSILKVGMAAISACHVGVDGVTPGTHPQLWRFLKGVLWLRSFFELALELVDS